MGNVVYVQSKNGKTIMPTERHGKVRRMLRDGLAIIVCKNPFTIRLTYESKENVQYSKLPLDTVMDSYTGTDYKAKRDEEKYFAQCKKENSSDQFDNPRRSENTKNGKRYQKRKRYHKPKTRSNKGHNQNPNSNPTPAEA